MRTCWDCAKSKQWTEYGQHFVDCESFDWLLRREQKEYLDSEQGTFAERCPLFVRDERGEAYEQA